MNNKPSFRLTKFAAFSLGLSVAMLSPQFTQAADSGWAVDAAGNWVDSPNWDNGVPGLANPGTPNSTDIATFGFPLTAPRIVTVDANRNIGGITFSNTSAFGYSLSTGLLKLTNGGLIQTASGNGNHTDSINSAVQIQGDTGSATFTANATSTTSLLRFNGTISGVSTGANFTTLTLDGNNVGSSAGVNLIDTAISGRITLVKSGVSRWTLNNASTFTGGTTVNNGSLFANSSTAFGVGGVITLGDATPFNSNSALIGLSGSTLTNNIVVAAGSSGTLTLGTSASTAAPATSETSGTITLNNNLTLIQDRNSNTRTFTASGVITGGSTITALGQTATLTAGASGGNGGSTVIISADNGTTFTGDTRINTATLRFSNNSLGNAVTGQGDGGILFTGNGVLQWAAGNTQDISNKGIDSTGFTGVLDLGTNNVTFGTANGLTGSGNITKFAGSAGVLTLNANNLSGTYTADSTGGATRLVNTNALQNATVNILSGVTTGGIVFDSSVGGAFTFGNLTGAGALPLQDNAGSPAPVALTVGGNNGSPAAYAGVLSGAGSLTKVGTGTLALNAINTFSGGLTIREGTVSATNINSLGASGTGAVALGHTTGSASATLLGGAGTYANPITVQTNAAANTNTLGNSGSSATVFSGLITLNDDLTVASDGTGTVNLSGAATGASLAGARNFTVTSLTPAATNVTIGGNNASFTGNVRVGSGSLRMGSATGLNSANTVSVASGAGNVFNLNDFSQTIAGLNDVTGFTGGTVVNTGGSADTLTLGGSGAYAFSGAISPVTTNRIALTVALTGGGTQILSGTNTYSGLTTVSGGTLLANTTGGTNSATGTGAVLVSAGGTLGGTGQILPTGANGITVASGGFLAPGASIGTLTVDSGGSTAANILNLSSGAQFKFELGTGSGTFVAPGTSDLLVIANSAVGDVAFNTNNIDFLGTGLSGVYKLFDGLPTATEAADSWTGLTLSGRQITGGLTSSGLGGGLSGVFYLGDGGSFGDAGDIYFSVVPEPSSFAMLIVGFGLLVGFQRARHSAKRI